MGLRQEPRTACQKAASTAAAWPNHRVDRINSKKFELVIHLEEILNLIEAQTCIGIDRPLLIILT